MNTRRDAREWAVQVLFGLDLNPGGIDKALQRFWHERKGDPEARQFCEELVRGVWAQRENLDRQILSYAEHWDVKRMATVDRNVLRMALYEMLHRPDIPPVVSINEAVDIVKYLSSSEAGRFVNGILDRARKDLKRPARTKDGKKSSPKKVRKNDKTSSQ